jgi:hypothetical protein
VPWNYRLPDAGRLDGHLDCFIAWYFKQASRVTVAEGTLREETTWSEVDPETLYRDPRHRWVAPMYFVEHYLRADEIRNGPRGRTSDGVDEDIRGALNEASNRVSRYLFGQQGADHSQPGSPYFRIEPMPSAFRHGTVRPDTPEGQQLIFRQLRTTARELLETQRKRENRARHRTATALPDGVLPEGTPVPEWDGERAPDVATALSADAPAGATYDREWDERPDDESNAPVDTPATPTSFDLPTKRVPVRTRYGGTAHVVAAWNREQHSAHHENASPPIRGARSRRPDRAGVENRALRREQREKLNRLLDGYRGRDRRIVWAWANGDTHDEIANDFGINRQRVGQILASVFLGLQLKADPSDFGLEVDQTPELDAAKPDEAA